MCGDTNRPSFGGTIAVLFPQENPSTSPRSSPDSFASSPSSSASSISSYSLLFRDAETSRRNTRAIFRTDDADTYQVLRACRQVDMRIERYGDLTTSTLNTPPLHQFKLDLSRHHSCKADHRPAEMEIELPERLDLGVSEEGVVGRQVTMREAGGAILGTGIVGYN